MKPRIFCAYVDSVTDTPGFPWAPGLVDDLKREFSGFVFHTNPDEPFDLLLALVKDDSTALGVRIARTIWEKGKPVLIMYHGNMSSIPVIYNELKDLSYQVIQVRFTCHRDALPEISRAVQRFRLNTTSPMTFPCVESLSPQPGFMEEAEVYALQRK